MQQPGLVDFHCHLDLFPDHAQAITDADKAGVYTLTVTTTPKAWPRNHELTKATKHVRAALGLHPQLVFERAHEIDLWEKYLPESKYIGEVGLDAGPRYYRSLNEQKGVFNRILNACAEVGGKVLTVHSVRAAALVLDSIEKLLPREKGAVVLHWFTGSQSEARRAAQLGCYFSINREMLRTDKGRKLVASLPRHLILTETDCPFTQNGERPTRPEDVIAVVEAIADLNRVGVAETGQLVYDNLRALLLDQFR